MGLQVPLGVDHLVWIRKYRGEVLYGQLWEELGPIIRELALQREGEVVEGRLKVDHVHMLVSIPPKYSVAQVVGYVKARVRFGLQERWGAIEILWVRISGHGGIGFQPLVWTRRRYRSTSGPRKRLTRNWIS